MRFVVPTPAADSVAHRALEVEGFEHEERVVAGEYGYTELLWGLWKAGDPFCLVEWDIVPWPGALGLLAACDGPLCGYQYPLGHGVHPDWTDNLIVSFGCTAFHPARLPDLPDSVRQCPWTTLDGAVWTVLRGVDPHVHWPPVAHARRPPSED